MQHDDGRRLVRRGPDHAVFEIGRADGEEAGGGELVMVAFDYGSSFRDVSAQRADP